MTTYDTTQGSALLDRYAESTADRSLLGRIIWSSVRKTSVPVDVVKAAFTRHALERFAPPLSSPADVFRRVVKNVQTTIDHEDGTRTKVWAREIKSHPDEVVKRIVCEQMDSNGARLSYKQSWDLRYNKKLGKLDLYPINADEAGNMTSRDRHADPHTGDEHMLEIRRDFNESLTRIDQDGLRRALTNALDASDSICVRDTGGVYFVPQNKSDVVDGLIAISKELPGMQVMAVPMPDEPEHVDDMIGGITAATLSDADKLITDFQERKRAGTLTSRRLATMGAEHRKLKARLGNFQSLLRDNLTDATTRVEVLDGLLVSVLDLPVTD